MCTESMVSVFKSITSAHGGKVADNADELAELRRMQDRLRTLRDRLCEPKNNTNPRYHALSAAVSQLSRAMSDLEKDSGV